MKTLLEGRKDLLLHAADAKLGIELARTQRPDAILINVDLAGPSAPEFLKVLRADPATEAIPVMALAAGAAPEAIVKRLEAGFFQVLARREQLLHQHDAVGVVFDVKQPAGPCAGLGCGSGNHGQTPSHATASGTVRWSA